MLTEQAVKDRLKTAISKIIGENVDQMPGDEVLAEISKDFSAALNEAKTLGASEKEVEMTAKLNEAVAAIDADHVTALNEIADGYTSAIARLDEVVNKKFLALNESFKARLNDPSIPEVMVERLSTYLDSAIEELIPESTVIDEIKMQRLEKFYESIRKSVIVSNDEIQTVIANRLKDIDGTVQQLRESLNEALATKIQLRENVNKLETEKLLNESLKSIPSEVAERVRTRLDGKTLSETKSLIKECIDTVSDELLVERRRLADTKRTKTATAAATIVEHREQIAPGVVDAYAKTFEALGGTRK